MTFVSFGQVSEIKDFELKEGKYYIDVLKENYHSFKHFNLELSIVNDKINLTYLSSEEFGHSEFWEKGDIYAIGDLNKKEEKGIPLKVWETRRGEKNLLMVTI